MDKLTLIFGALIFSGLIALAVIYFPHNPNAMNDLSLSIKRMAVGH